MIDFGSFSEIRLICSVYNITHYYFLGIEIAKCVQAKQETKLLKEFKEILLNDKDILEKTEALKKKVVSFASSFPMPGHDDI